MWWEVLFVGCLGGHCADGGVVVGFWVSALCLGFPYKEAYLLGSKVFRPSSLAVYPNQNLLGTLPGDGVSWNSGFFL